MTLLQASALNAWRDLGGGGKWRKPLALPLSLLLLCLLSRNIAGSTKVGSLQTLIPLVSGVGLTSAAGMLMYLSIVGTLLVAGPAP